jgi:pilus assembly protein CpaE
VIVVVEPEESSRQRLMGHCEPLGEVVPATSLQQAALALERAGAGGCVVVLGPGVPRADALLFAEKAETERGGGIATIITAETLQADLLREALRSGVADVMTLGASPEEWNEALARAQARSANARLTAGADDAERGRVVAVFSTKGGTGKSFVASNIAAIAAERLGREVALVDLDLHSGDIALMYQLVPGLTVHDAAAAAESLDAEAMRGYLTSHRSGVSVLAAPQDLTYADEVDAEAITVILRQLASMFPAVVIDGPPVFTDQMLAALDVADEIVVVGAMDVPTIKNLKLAISTLVRLGQPREKLRIVLNRSDSKVGLNITEVEKSIGVGIDVEIPSSRDVPLSINQGIPLAVLKPRSPVTASLRDLTALVLPEVAQRSRGPRRLRR